MKARIDTGRFGIRVFFLLIVQTVCLAALPSGAPAVQEITGTVICTELPGESDTGQIQQAGIRQHQNRSSLTYQRKACDAAVIRRSYTLPVRRTLVLNQVRNDN